jgi:hypothetical protein
MPPFQYDQYRSPYVGSISQLIQAPGQAYARAAELGGNAQAAAAQQSGNAWAGAAQNIGQAVAAIPQQIQQAKAQDQVNQLRGMQLAEAQQQQQGRASVDQLMAGDQMAPGDTGPRRPSYLDSKGLFDIQGLTAALASSGHGHMAPELLKGAEQINESITKHQAAQQQAAQQQSLLVGDLAAGTLKMSALGVAIPDAMDFVVQPAIANKAITPEDYAKIRQQIAALPPEQQSAALTTFMDRAAQLGGTKVLTEGATETDRYGRVIAKGAPKPPTEVELKIRAAQGDQEAIKALAAGRPEPKRTENELALDAYAKSIGKTKAEDLSYEDRQTFDKNKAAITSSVAFQQHMRERQYDIANPVPEKAISQPKLEQEYRTVLARAMSSRSGGIGMEDAKVQQANHALGMMDQFYDPKTGEYNIPTVQLNELALSLAKLTAGTSPAGEGMMKEFQQKTAKGDIAAGLTYLTGQPIAANTQAITKMLRESIERQGHIAEQNREGSMGYLRGLAPTDLDEQRRMALEANSLNPLRQSKVLVNPKGERRLVTSIDGGKTWQ